MSKKLKLVPGRRHPHKPPQGDVSGSKRKSWFEVYHAFCGSVTRGSLGYIRRCAGGSPNAAKNNEVKHGCGMRFE